MATRARAHVTHGEIVGMADHNAHAIEACHGGTVGGLGCFDELSQGIQAPSGPFLKLKSAKECVTTHLSNQLAPKMDGA
ncbi:hypothetical protein HPP92_021167 [Vanilla planifolia]|uniref:Uncharacterized protein n=1 Tax=Vanilla planifolia TaxID=51239 RepID=A0A835UHB0_VANPL|nr:hypothetical protein HPP92_021167 [Vanilla planifolia]